MIRTEKASKSYSVGPSQRLEVLHEIDLEIEQGDAICIMGASGAGKSTLMHILSALDRPTSGKVFFQDRDLSEESDEELARFRNVSMGFVFQFHHLLSEFTALENVMMPCRISRTPVSVARDRAIRLLDELGLLSRKDHFPSELSGGEQQRVAVARALIQSPTVLFADEPTGNLDSTNGHVIQELFFELRERRGLTLVTVTHDQNFARRFQIVMTLKDGRWQNSSGNLESSLFPHRFT